ncbi:MAG: recombinase family protein, partial [Gemmatimonadetes bacterium]|nr:recombinase family protein [Gemmatimonadota bacterium]
MAAANGVVPRRLRYLRKSTLGDERQVASHEQQDAEADKTWGCIAPEWVWKDSCSGTTFNRPAFQDLLDFCRANPQQKKTPGQIEMYDPSRFGRILDELGEPDVHEFQRVLHELDRLGWRVLFVTLRRSDEPLSDMMLIIVHAYAAAQYSKTLSKNVRRGRSAHAKRGWWTNGGAPWGTKRKDTKTNRILAAGEPSTPGGGGTTLVPDVPALKLWQTAAKRILNGASLDKVGVELFEKGVRGPRGGKLGHRSIRNFLTNPALIGRTTYRDAAGPDGARPPREVDAKWGPMVDVELFLQVSVRLSGHSCAPHTRHRQQREKFPLALRCAHCGGAYVGGQLGVAQGATRGYAHAKPKARMDAEGRARFDAAGCKVWYVNADEIEDGIKNLIIAQRSSKEFEDELRSVILERDSFRRTATDAVEESKREVASRKLTLDRLKGMAAKLAAAAASTASENLLVEQINEAQQRLNAAQTDLRSAEAFAKSKEDAWSTLSSIIHETRDLGKAWSKVGVEGRKALLDYWVYDALIAVERMPGMRRANHKAALITLRSAPNTPLAIDLGGERGPGQPRTDAARRSTSASVSKGKRSRIAA